MGRAVRLEERKVAIGDLLVGMYVCRLDRDWAGTPFPLQGVLIRSDDDIAALAGYSSHVYIDIELGLPPRDERPFAEFAALNATIRRPAVERDERQLRKLLYSVSHANTTTFAEELPKARLAQTRVAEFASRVLDDVRDGKPVAIAEVQEAVTPMVNSVLRNMDAYMWIETLRKRDAYEYSHALNCSALAAAFGRHIGLPDDVLLDLASGGLLLDIGKLRVPPELLARKGALDTSELAQVRRHVEHGLDVLETDGRLPATIRDMIATHHERIDGQGYPARLSDEAIPLLGRIAAVIDSYDAMTSERVHRRAMSRHDALQELYRNRNKLYAAEIVEQFMQCLGVYPTGSLVELSNGCVAIVMAQNPARRLSPRVMVLTTPEKRLQARFEMLDLVLQTEKGPSAGVRIINTLEPGTHGLDPTELYL